MQIYIGSDHAGYTLKNKIHDYLEKELHCAVTDLGVFSEDATGYPDIGREVAEKVYENSGSFGVLIAGKGTGMCQSAHMHRGMRVIPCVDEAMARRSRVEDGSNVLCLRAEGMEESFARQIVKTFLSTSFPGGPAKEKKVTETYEMLKKQVKRKRAIRNKPSP